MSLPSWLGLLVSSLLPASAVWINSGTPVGVPEDYDCAIRKLVYNRSQELLPERGAFRTLFEALQLQNCNLTTPVEMDHWQPPALSPPTDSVVYADSSKGNDSHPGSLAQPVKSLEQAAELASKLKQPATISLRAGTYFVQGTLDLSARRFPLGVHLMNFQGERCVVSGGQPLQIPATSWSQVRNEEGWKRYSGWNNMQGLVPNATANASCCQYLGVMPDADSCEKAASAHQNAFTSYVFHESISGPWLRTCYGIRAPFGFHPIQQDGVVTGRWVQTNLWQADLSESTQSDTMRKLLEDGDGFPGLRLNGERMIRAKYPDGSPEMTGQWLYGAGQAMGGGDYVDAFVRDGFTAWAPPRRRPAAQDVIVTADDWPEVEWPKTSPDGSTTWTGMGDFGEFYLGVGGTCDDVTPSVGYWCGDNAPRHVQAHNSPSGIFNASRILPHFQKYTSNASAKPVINAWRGGGRWFSWQFLVDEVNPRNDSLTFSSKRGGNQGAEGVNSGGQWWIENVLPECDAPNEFFYDPMTRSLYVSFNGSKVHPDGSEKWVVPATQVILNITSSNSSVRGIEIRDSKITYLEPHGLPSGGDWAIERLGSVFIGDADNVRIEDCHFTRLDGNGVFLDGAVKNALLQHNEFSYIGNSAMAAWGYTSDCLNTNCTRKLPAGSRMGPDGRAMHAPIGTVVRRNLVREIGIWQKQSSMWFQAVAAESQILENVHFNGPRAGINFNDGFGGGDLIEGNVVGNCVRESGDHGPYNSWDRVPYITTLRTGKPSIIPKDRHFTRNLWFGTYSTQEGADTDDGSSYMLHDSNVFAFGTNGLKNDFGGHDNRHSNNMYLFVDTCWGMGFGPGTKDGSANNDAFTDNSCLLKPRGSYGSDCGNNPFGFLTYGNQIYTQDGTLQVCGGHDLNEYVAHSGRDPGSSVAKWPSAADLVSSAGRLLRRRAPSEQLSSSMSQVFV